MSRVLWGPGEAPELDPALREFLAGEDIRLDAALFPFDIRATMAHVRGLERIGILDAAESGQLCTLLERLDTEFQAGRFDLDERFEDGHSAIEFFLTEHAGAAGEKVHTGRSRNDQVLAASRLYIKHATERLAQLDRDVGTACLDRAEADAGLPMPGYTHLQRAVPSSVGMWLGGFAEAFADDLDFARAVVGIIDCSPLGTAAGYGVNLPLDRDGVAAELGFSRLQINPVNAQLSRGKFEVMALQAASHALHDVRRLAWDLSLFTTAEFGFVSLPPEYATGSSIMPNKRNPDVIELLRGRAAAVDAAIHEVQAIVALPSGYHRDLQLVKGPMIRGIHAALQALAIVPGLVCALRFDEQRMRDAISDDMFLTDAAIELAVRGEPFRRAYRKVLERPESRPAARPEDSLARRVSPGASGDLRLDQIRRRLNRK